MLIFCTGSLNALVLHRRKGGGVIGHWDCLGRVGESRLVNEASVTHPRSIQEWQFSPIFRNRKRLFVQRSGSANQERLFEHADIRCGFPHTTEVGGTSHPPKRP